MAAGFAASSPASAAPTQQSPESIRSGKNVEHNLLSPQAVKQDALRQVALQRKLEGDPSAQGPVVRVGGTDAAPGATAGAKASASATAPQTHPGKDKDKTKGKGQYVKLEQRGHGPDLRGPRRVRRHAAPSYCDSTTAAVRAPSPRTARPRSTTVRSTTRSPSPTGRVDNSTLWQADYDQAHYENMYFNRMDDVLRAPVLGPLHRQRRRDRVGQGALQRGALRP